MKLHCKKFKKGFAIHRNVLNLPLHFAGRQARI